MSLIILFVYYSQEHAGKNVLVYITDLPDKYFIIIVICNYTSVDSL